jgi:hypothetical protein
VIHSISSTYTHLHPCNQLLVNLNAQLTKVLLIPHVLVRVFGLVESEDFLVDDGLDVVGFDGVLGGGVSLLPDYGVFV